MYFRLMSVLALLVVGSIGCNHIYINPVPFRNLSEDRPSLPGFYAWETSDPDKNDTFQLFLINEKGNLKKVPAAREKPSRPFNQIGARLFYPEKASATNDLNESPEIISVDGQWAVKTSSVKTFADDLDNDHLIVRNTAKGILKEVTVPALSNGVMIPLFWHPQKAVVYFMVSVGDDTGRSLQLWEYDLTSERFQNIGDTNGDAFINRDGSWIIWETGPTLDKGHLKPPFHCVALCAYDTTRKINYQLTTDQSIAFFQRWTVP
jgi:hypothetical protein